MEMETVLWSFRSELSEANRSQDKVMGRKQIEDGNKNGSVRRYHWSRVMIEKERLR